MKSNNEIEKILTTSLNNIADAIVIFQHNINILWPSVMLKNHKNFDAEIRNMYSSLFYIGEQLKKVNNNKKEL